jgi:hypothetical protein
MLSPAFSAALDSARVRRVAPWAVAIASAISQLLLDCPAVQTGRQGRFPAIFAFADRLFAFIPQLIAFFQSFAAWTLA